MADLFEVLLVDDGQRWHAGVLVDDDTETDVLLTERGRVLVFDTRAALEHHAQERDLYLEDEMPDEIDLDLAGWLTSGAPLPSTAEVLELWNLLYDDPVAGRALSGEDLAEAYDDLVEDVPDWFDEHGAAARRALADAVSRLRTVMRPA